MKIAELDTEFITFLSIVKYLWGVSPIFSHCCIYTKHHRVPVLTRAIIPQCSRCGARVQLFTPSVFIMAAPVLRNDEFIQFYPPKQQLCRSIVSTGARAAAAWFKYFYVLISIKAAAAVSADGALCNWLSRLRSGHARVQAVELSTNLREDSLWPEKAPSPHFKGLLLW